jgi:type III pantothenate kinase
LNLVIDIGNTRIKLAVFDGSTLISSEILTNLDELFITKKDFSLYKHAIISSVVNNLDSFYAKISNEIHTIIFNAATKLPIANNYQSVSTLGSDRLAAAVGAHYLYPNSNKLVIDAGTCIKYNFINDKNEFLGGGISPGLKMKFTALNLHTSKLPLVSFTDSEIELIGNNTENSILSGVLNGSVAEIDGTINSYKAKFPDTLILLTGGDCDFFAKRLKNSIFAHQNLVLKGLNDILNYNLEIK